MLCFQDKYSVHSGMHYISSISPLVFQGFETRNQGFIKFRGLFSEGAGSTCVPETCTKGFVYREILATKGEFKFMKILRKIIISSM